MACTCAFTVEKNLAAIYPNAAIVKPILMLDGRAHDEYPVEVALYRRDGTRRGKLPALFATYCPFCGVAYRAHKPDVAPEVSALEVSNA